MMVLSEANNEMTPLVRKTWSVHSKSVFSKYRVCYFQGCYIRFYLAASFVIALVLIFSPVAGFLSDVKFSRYKTLFYNLWLITVSSLAVFAMLCIGR